MRLVHRLSSALLVVVAMIATTAPCALAQGTARDLARARTLDQQGARAYAEGRYGDAIRYFEEAYRLGAPPVELWNIAKCHDKVDQPEKAAVVLERYLAQPDLPKSDREEAQQMLDGIKKRPSSLTVTSSPEGASVVLDGKAVQGRTPLTTTVGPGRHEVSVSRPGHATYGTTFEARFGRAVIVDTALKPGESTGTTTGAAAAPPTTTGSGPTPSSGTGPAAATSTGGAAGAGGHGAAHGGARAGAPHDADHGTTPPEKDDRPLTLRAAVGLEVARYGDVGGGAEPALAALGTYRIGTAGAARIALGAMVHVAFDSWRNTTNVPDVAVPCGQLKTQNDGVGISAYGVATASWLLHPEVSAGAIAGIGLAGYVADQLGGDLFQPACSPRTGILPAVVLGGEVDWRLSPGFRLSLFPLLLHVQPAFDGTRVAPRDASGVWVRATFGIGGGFDL